MVPRAVLFTTVPAEMSHRTVRDPTDAEHAELKRMKREEIGRVAVWAHIALLSYRGHSAQEIAELHDVTDPMVYKWIERFDEEGPSGLYDREREGRPRKIDDEVESEIERLLEGAQPRKGTTPRGGPRPGSRSTCVRSSAWMSTPRRCARR